VNVDMAVGRSLGGLCLCVALLTACDRDTKQPSTWQQAPGYRWRELVVPRGKAGFTPVQANRSQVAFQNTVSEAALLRNRILGQGAGVAIGDVDSDGLVDVFFGRTEGCNALYRNLGDWRFEDITARAGVGACDRYTTGATFADIDSDRDLDLVLLATNGPNAFFVNDGHGVFAERRDLGLDTTGRGGTTITMADVDGDGRLDMYVANYKSWFIDDSIPPQERGPGEMVRQVAANRYEVTERFRDYYKLVMRPDMGGLRLTTRADPDELYLNTGGSFTRVATASGFLDADGKALTEAPESFGLTARFVDLDGDRAPDLYVANDFEDADELWFNDGKGRFRRAPWTAQRQQSNASMGVDVADVNADGLPDLFVVDMLSKDTRRLKMQTPTHTAFAKTPADFAMLLQHQRNTLYLNRGDRTFAEVAALAGVQASGWSWSTVFLDADLDGWQDILITAGHLWDIMDADTHERLQARMPEFDFRRFRWQFPALRLTNVAYRNRGDLTFEDVSDAWNFSGDEAISHAMATGDLDGDGDLDVVINRLGSPALVLRNDATAPRVAVRLIGDAPNTRAIGARIRLLGGAVPLQEKEVSAGGIYMSHSDEQAAFAMGRSDSATIVVDWRDGRQTVIPAVRGNRLYEISQQSADMPRPRVDSVSPPLFVDASAALGAHKHVDPPFDDWQRQLLLPNSLAYLGPGVAWFDYDRDGDEDLFVGAGKGGRLGVFRNDRGRLAPQTTAGPVAPQDFTSVLGMSAGSAGRILAGVASWEGNVAASVIAIEPRGTPRSDAVVEGLESSAGALALGDYDSDGDLDLFVGGRALPAQFPRAASSALYRNDNGRFTVDTTRSAALQRVGLVSAASFADLDNDGDADLLLAREWDSILLLLNQSGRFEPAPATWGLARWTSRWNGIATGDLDGDGRLDIVATSWGRNTMTPADSARPLVMLHGPFGARGEEELLLAREDPRVRALVPLNGFGRVRAGVADVPDRIRTFAQYADASVEQVLGAGIAQAERKPVVSLDHMVFLNRGNRFEGIALPLEAQFAPAFYAGIADFTGDGREDVFLTQNFTPTAMGLPRYDAGRGLVLAGDGKGGLRALSGAQSGVIVYGDQRGAGYTDFDNDGRLDLAIAQNSATTRLFRNASAKPGLRVRLRGGLSNPDAIGAQVRLVYGDRFGPVREIQAGSGYWSQNGAVQVFGLEEGGTPSAVWVRWPGGAETRVPVPLNAKEVVVAR
jgi:hypothetical protein